MKTQNERAPTVRAARLLTLCVCGLLHAREQHREDGERRSDAY
jgi:hypothetical protein